MLLTFWYWLLDILQRVVAFGSLGMLVENFYTGISSLKKKHWDAPCRTYLWMFFIYGAGGLLLEKLHDWLTLNHFLAALLFTVVIFTIEFSAGWLIERLTGKCPWKYVDDSGVKVHKRSIMGLIRLDYAPLWYGLALAFDLYSDRIKHILNAISRIQ